MPPRKPGSGVATATRTQSRVEKMQARNRDRFERDGDAVGLAEAKVHGEDVGDEFDAANDDGGKQEGRIESVLTLISRTSMVRAMCWRRRQWLQSERCWS